MLNVLFFNQLKYIIWKTLYFLLSNVFLGFFVLENKELFSKIIPLMFVRSHSETSMVYIHLIFHENHLFIEKKLRKKMWRVMNIFLSIRKLLFSIIMKIIINYISFSCIRNFKHLSTNVFLISFSLLQWVTWREHLSKKLSRY